MNEYAILIAVVSAALIAMQIYARRGLQGVIKLASDEVGLQQSVVLDPDKNIVSSEYSLSSSYTKETTTTEIKNGSVIKDYNKVDKREGMSEFSDENKSE